MCRLLATASPEPSTVAEVLGSERIRVFQDMATVHDDGWGCAWLEPNGTLSAQRATESGYAHSGLAGALLGHAARAQLVHLRLATDGLSCTIANTHPFLADGLAFAHNGSLMPVSAMRDLIDDEIWETLRGDTDSERYFAVIRTGVAAGRSLTDSAVAAACELRARFPLGSLNAILLSRTELIAIHAHETARVPVSELARHAPGGELPLGHDEGYYEMHVLRTPEGSVAIASSGMDVQSWETLPSDSVTSISLQSLEMTSVPLSSAQPTAASGVLAGNSRE